MHSDHAEGDGPVQYVSVLKRNHLLLWSGMSAPRVRDRYTYCSCKRHFVTLQSASDVFHVTWMQIFVRNIAVRELRHAGCDGPG